MDLQGITAAAVGTVNPIVPATLRISTGAVDSASGKPVPSYATPVTVQAQVQALGYRDLMQVQGLNLNGTKRAIYVHGMVEGVNRISQKGGDLISFGAGLGPLSNTTWLTAQVLEQWPDWCKVAVTEQIP